MLLIIAFRILLFVAFLTLCIYVPGVMATNRDRNPFGWIIASFFVTPIVTIGLLFYLGPKRP